MPSMLIDSYRMVGLLYYDPNTYSTSLPLRVEASGFCYNSEIALRFGVTRIVNQVSVGLNLADTQE